MHFSGAVPAQHVPIPSGLAGVKATLRLMVELVRRYKAHPLIRQTAVALVQGCPERSEACEAAALQSFVRDSIRYVADVAGVETLQTPVVTLGYLETRPPTWDLSGRMLDPGEYAPGGTAAGDCDDKSVLLATLLQAISIPGRFCAVGVNGEALSHVLVEARLRQRNSVTYLPLETILPGVPAGWFPPDASCFMVAHFA